jgi:hypothetical protein
MTALYWWIFGIAMFTASAPFLLWGHFLVVMSIKRVWQGKQIAGLTLWMGVVWLWIGYLLDFWSTSPGCRACCWRSPRS